MKGTVGEMTISQVIYCRAISHCFYNFMDPFMPQCVSTSWACCGLLDIRRVAKPWRNSCKIDFKGILLLPFSPIEKKREKSESETNPGRRKIASIQTVINQILFSGFESPMSLRINTIQFYQEKYITFIRIGY
ncbi:uncharacterized protein LOC135364513 isoform X3 [Mirounga angustirostris]|uniref:uncharacterized protein LOC135364513 isoform X3 n=1 Tax=Mirounga angustirostris TaxID=9716 RepID=UPI00313C58CD